MQFDFSSDLRHTDVANRGKTTPPRKIYKQLEAFYKNRPATTRTTVGARQVGKITYFQIYMPMFLQKQELLEEITFETDFSYLGDLK